MTAQQAALPLDNPFTAPDLPRLRGTERQIAFASRTPTRDAGGAWLTRWPGVTVRIDPPRHVVPFAGALDVDPGTGGTAFEHSFTTGRRAKLGEWRRIHVMSAHAGGEIRGYELEVGGELLLAYPCYTGIWPEMDAEVARIVAAAAQA
ncbi:MAG TPA: hypothetical protein P5234_15955 [Thermoanaerobaculaceae bacterium]|nr:hypothetical protein [Thermoanaerobaculaceae bacterium]